MRTRLKWLSLRSFRSFVERTVIQFPESGVVPVRGFNLETGGSSGSGKSSVNLAIAYALGICPFPATALQSWLTEVPLQVELCLETDAGEMIISRGEKFSVSVAGEMIKGNAKATEEKISQLLGLSPEILEALTYRKQQSRGQFLSRTNTQKQEFLTGLLGLEKFEIAIEKTQARIRELEPNVKFVKEDVKRCEDTVNQRKLASNQPAVVDEAPLRKTVEDTKVEIRKIEEKTDAIKLVLVAKEKKIQEFTDGIICSAMPQLREIEAQIKTLKELPVPTPDLTEEKRLDDLLVQAKEHLAHAIAEDKEGLEAEQNNARALQGQLDCFRRDLAERNQIKTKGMKLLTEIDSLEKNVCPTCNQQWAAAQEQKKKLQREMEQLALDLRKYDDVETKISHLTDAVAAAWKHTPHPDIDRLRKIQSQLMWQSASEEQNNAHLEHLALAERKQQIAEAKAKLNSIRTSTLESAQRHQGDSKELLQDSYQELEDLQNRLKSANARLQGCQNEAYQVYTKNNAAKQQAETEARLLKDAERLLAASQTRAEEVTRRLTAEQDFLALVGREGFLGNIFFEVLWEISTETNAILNEIPNTSHITVNFTTESTTQKGKIVKEITPIVRIDGHEAPLKSGCSGGMLSAVELAVDLAVGRVVSRRTGVIPAWLILDESMEGLGACEKDGVLSILQRYSLDNLVLLVDHASELKGVGSSKIDVTFEKGESKIAIYNDHTER